MDANELPSDVEQLKAMLVATLAEKKEVLLKATQLQQQTIELSVTVADDIDASAAMDRGCV